MKSARKVKLPPGTEWVGDPSLRTFIERCRPEDRGDRVWHNVKPFGFLDGFLVKLDELIPNMDAANQLFLHVQLAYHHGGVAAESEHFHVQSVCRPVLLRGEIDEWDPRTYRGEAAILP